MPSQGLMRLFGERGPQLVVVVLIVALGLDSALILTRALSGPAVPAPAARTGNALPFGSHSKNPQLILATIVNAHLFGAAPLANGTDAPPTNMQLVLTGVIAVKGHPDLGQAIIGANVADAKLYTVGAAISGGARLHAVYDDRVLLERNGTLETLMLPRNMLNGVGVTAAAPVAAARSDIARANPDVLAGLLRVQPVFSQGRLSGYRIFPGGPHGNQVFMQLGLRPGDLITAVNGTTLDDPARALEILQTLSSSGSASVTVTRNGSPLEVNLNLAGLDLDTPGGQTGAANAGAVPSPPVLMPMRRGPFGPRAQ